MFEKILIANRGEIACRVIHTAKNMGIATVAVASPSDAHAKHAEMADEVHSISDYLNHKDILHAALATGAQAIHPGYGFLSENPPFVRAVEKAGLVFIGPPAAAIQKMGLKDKAKALMEKAGVPIIPGYHGDNQQLKFLQKQADAIGYPLLIKARAGGGGKGIRLVENPGEFAAALQMAASEAKASFDDGACLLERFITKPRHVEVQVFCDSFGNGVHIFERDCSLQRRHQKIIEEAPAPHIPEHVREQLGAAAVTAALSIGYRNAGTVEFIYSQATQEFMFMEMNTRLQVEHPVSEAISGFDFVEWQLRIAAGQKLPLTQAEISNTKQGGHAIEARIYAEDVTRNFAPSVGRIHHYNPPRAAEFTNAPVRIDSGIRQGDNITPYYDPMIGKIIAYGKDRHEALAKLRVALQKFHIAGVTSNIGFLHALCNLPSFVAGDLHTGLIEKHMNRLLKETQADEKTWGIAALAAMGFLKGAGEKPSPQLPKQLRGFHNWGRLNHSCLLRKQEKTQTCSAEIDGDNYIVAIGDKTVSLSRSQMKHTKYVRHGDNITVFHGGNACEFSLARQQSTSDEKHDRVVTSPLPAVVKDIFVKQGATVKKGDKLLVVEAMKMQTTLTAETSGKIKTLSVKIGDTVTEGATLLEFA